MRQLSGFLLKSIRDMLRWNVLRFALLLGLPLAALWVGVGYQTWDMLVALCAKVIGWIPFSVVKANGAMMILFFIWLIAVLVSFAALTALVGPPILRYFKERTYYFYTFTALLGFSGFWAAAMFYKWDEIFPRVEKLLALLPFNTVAEASAGLLAFYLLYNLFILSLFFAVSLFRKRFLEPLREQYYPSVTLPQERVGRFHGVRLINDAFFFLVISLISAPVLFIPIANVIVQLFLWAWLYKESYFLSTCNLYCSKADHENLTRHRAVIAAVAIMAAVLNFVPVVNIFTPFFAQLMFFHWIMEHRQSQKSEEA